MTRSRWLALALLALASAASPARAGFSATMAGTASAQGGEYLYTYTVTDSMTSTVNLSEFDVNVNDPIGLSAITATGDFINTYTAGDSYISFISTGNGLAPGQTATFSFLSYAAPGMVADQSLAYDSTAPNGYSTVDGFVIGASVIPEPSSLLLVSSGLVGALGLIARGRRPSA